MEPALKYCGSKRWLVPRLAEMFDPRRRLVEPFVGSMAVALGLQPERALLGDANPHLINFHHRLRDPRPFSTPMLNHERFYYAQREVFNKLAALRGAFTTEGAEIFYYLNRTCFNGLCRFNKLGAFNVPFGKYAAISYRYDFTEYVQPLWRWTVCSQAWQLTMSQAQSGDFVFADPPYDGTFDTYSGEEFSWKQQEMLAETLARHNGPVVATNAATERVLALYRSYEFDVELVSVRRSISASGDRVPAQEMLATRNIERRARAANE